MKVAYDPDVESFNGRPYRWYKYQGRSPRTGETLYRDRHSGDVKFCTDDEAYAAIANGDDLQPPYRWQFVRADSEWSQSAVYVDTLTGVEELHSIPAISSDHHKGGASEVQPPQPPDFYRHYRTNRMPSTPKGTERTLPAYPRPEPEPAPLATTRYTDTEIDAIRTAARAEGWAARVEQQVKECQDNIDASNRQLATLNRLYPTGEHDDYYTHWHGYLTSIIGPEEQKAAALRAEQNPYIVVPAPASEDF